MVNILWIRMYVEGSGRGLIPCHILAFTSERREYAEPQDLKKIRTSDSRSMKQDCRKMEGEIWFCKNRPMKNINTAMNWMTTRRNGDVSGLCWFYGVTIGGNQEMATAWNSELSTKLPLSHAQFNTVKIPRTVQHCHCPSHSSTLSLSLAQCELCGIVQ